MRLQLITATLTSLALFGCGARNETSETKIVGGRLVNKDEVIARHTVTLVDAETGMSFCSGTLIAPSLVLTAAHCVQGVQGLPNVGFGVNAQDGFAAASRMMATHADFNLKDGQETEEAVNDIGLIALAKPAPKSAVPAKILSKNIPLVNRERVTLAGYGITKSETDEGIGSLRALDTLLLEQVENKKEVVVGEKIGRMACNGDSGGPMFVTRNGELMVAGVASRVVAGCKKLGIYTDVRYFSEWILGAQKKMDATANR